MAARVRLCALLSHSAGTGTLPPLPGRHGIPGAGEELARELSPQPPDSATRTGRPRFRPGAGPPLARAAAGTGGLTRYPEKEARGADGGRLHGFCTAISLI